jgi:hypothetical protein
MFQIRTTGSCVILSQDQPYNWGLLLELQDGVVFPPLGAVAGKGGKGSLPINSKSMKLPLTWLMRMRTGIHAFCADTQNSTLASKRLRG